VEVTKVTILVEKPGQKTQKKELFITDSQVRAITNFGIAGDGVDVAGWAGAELESMITCLEDISRVG
jgi:hypothetical protein